MISFIKIFIYLKYLLLSVAKDLSGFNQREIFKIITENNLKKTAENFKYMIINTYRAKNNNFFVHNISKIIFKKMKDNIEPRKDLRAITITPAIIMVHDKILMTYLKKEIDEIFSKKQHGARPGLITNTAKLNIVFNGTQKGLNHIMLLDLTKAFDKVNRNILKEIINRLENKNIDMVEPYSKYI